MSIEHGLDVGARHKVTRDSRAVNPSGDHRSAYNAVTYFLFETLARTGKRHGVIAAVHVFVLAAHLLAVNFATAAPFFALYFEWSSARKQDADRDRLARWLAIHTLTALAIAIFLGFCLFALAWASSREPYFRALSVYRHRIEMGVAELAFSIVLFVAYAWPWQWWHRHRIWHRLLCLVAATNLAYHFPVLFVLLGHVSTRPDLLDNPPPFIRLLSQPQCIAALVHYFLASIAVTGVALIVYALGPRRHRESDEFRTRLVAWGGSVAVLPTVLQLLVGLYLLLQLPRPVRGALLGADLWATSTFVVSLLAAFWLMQCLMTLAFGEASRVDAVKAIGLMVATITLMVAARHVAYQTSQQLPPTTPNTEASETPSLQARRPTRATPSRLQVCVVS